MSPTNELYTKKLYNFLASVLGLLGYWEPFGSSKFIRVLHRLYGGFIYIFVFIFTFFLLVSIFINSENEQLAKRLFMSTTKFAMLAKMIPLYFFNRRVQQIRHTIEQFHLKSAAEERKVENYVNNIAKVIYVYHAMPQIAITLWNFEAILSSERKLAFSGWYPGVDWQHNDQQYHWVLAYQVIVISITGFINMAADSYFCFAMYMISIEYELLGERLSELQLIGSERKTNEQLVAHAKTLQGIWQVTIDVKDTLAWSYFVQVIMSAIVIGSTVQELAKVCRLFLRFSNGVFYHLPSAQLFNKRFLLCFRAD